MALILAGTPDYRGYISPTLVPSLDVKKVVFGRCLILTQHTRDHWISENATCKIFCGRLDEW